MKKNYLLSLAITLCLSAFAQNNKQNGYQNERQLKILNRTVNLGNIQHDTILTAKFLFVNTGMAVVEIYSIKTDCICTEYSISKKVVSPSDTAYLELKLDTKNRDGLHKLYAVMETNTKTRMYKFTMIANVVKKNEDAI
jgi:hypothetical protein